MNGVVAARRLHPLRRHLPHLQRLQPQRHPHGRADEAPRGARVHARLHRPGRRRPDAPVDRARRLAAPHSEPRRLASGRHGGNCRGLGRGAAEPVAPRRRCCCSRQNIAYSPKSELGDISRGAYVLSEPEAVGLKNKKTRGRDHRHRLRSAARDCAPRSCWPAKKIGVRVVLDALHHHLRPPGPGLQEERAAQDAPRIAVEMGCTGGWWKYGVAAVVGIDTYGESAPARRAVQAFRFHGGERGCHGRKRRSRD